MSAQFTPAEWRLLIEGLQARKLEALECSDHFTVHEVENLIARVKALRKAAA